MYKWNLLKTIKGFHRRKDKSGIIANVDFIVASISVMHEILDSLYGLRDMFYNDFETLLFCNRIQRFKVFWSLYTLFGQLSEMVYAIDEFRFSFVFCVTNYG